MAATAVTIERALGFTAAMRDKLAMDSRRATRQLGAAFRPLGGYRCALHTD
jgi:hypothetical protein